MSERRSMRLIVAAVVWCVIVAIIAVAYRFLVHPYFQDRLQDSTGSDSQYKHSVKIAMDSFTGYCVLRSDAMRDLLKQKGIRWTVEDDGADYGARMTSLKRERVQMAVFTIDSFVASGIRNEEFPASIVLVLDETKGADAMVAYKDAVGKIQDLDDPSARIVATPNSPSEFLARVVLAQFSLPRMPERWLDEEDGAEAVYRSLRSADKKAKRAYVLWEPYVSRALEETGVEVLLDSSRMSGYIVDVLVVERQFLQDHADVVRDVVEAYLRASYSYSQQRGGLAELVMEDAKRAGGENLSREQADKLVAGIRWKNTLENYAHFGLAPPEKGQGLPHLEDMIVNITDVLVTTGAIKSNLIAGREHTLFYDQIVRELSGEDFHPGKKVNVISGLGLGEEDLETARADTALKKLTDTEWERLIQVGEMRVAPIAFARGTSRLNVQSERDLSQLAKRMKSFPQYYLTVAGHARAEGDREANERLALERAQSAAQALIAQGLHSDRIRVIAETPSAANGSAQSVAFVVGQLPY